MTETEREQIVDYLWERVMDQARANTRQLRGDLLASRTSTLAGDAIVMPNPERLVLAGMLTEKDRADLLSDLHDEPDYLC